MTRATIRSKTMDNRISALEVAMDSRISKLEATLEAFMRAFDQKFNQKFFQFDTKYAQRFDQLRRDVSARSDSIFSQGSDADNHEAHLGSGFPSQRLPLMNREFPRFCDGISQFLDCEFTHTSLFPETDDTAAEICDGFPTCLSLVDANGKPVPKFLRDPVAFQSLLVPKKMSFLQEVEPIPFKIAGIGLPAPFQVQDSRDSHVLYMFDEMLSSSGYGIFEFDLGFHMGICDKGGGFAVYDGHAGYDLQLFDEMTVGYHMRISDRGGGHSIFEVDDEFDGYDHGAKLVGNKTMYLGEILNFQVMILHHLGGLCTGGGGIDLELAYHMRIRDKGGGSIRGTTYTLPTLDEGFSFVLYDTQITKEDTQIMKEMSWCNGRQSQWYFKRSRLGGSCIWCVSEYGRF